MKYVQPTLMISPIKIISLMCSQVPSQTQNRSMFFTQRNCEELGARSQLSALQGVEGRAKASRWD